MIYLEKYRIYVDKATRRVVLPDTSTRELTKGEMRAFVAIVGGANSWGRLAAWMSDDVNQEREAAGLLAMSDNVISPLAAKKTKERLDRKLPGILPKFIGGRGKKP